jgi:hypothetical protein
VHFLEQPTFHASGMYPRERRGGLPSDCEKLGAMVCELDFTHLLITSC